MKEEFPREKNIEQLASTLETEKKIERGRIIEEIRRNYGILFISVFPPGFKETLDIEEDAQWFQDALGIEGDRPQFKTIKALEEELPNTIEEGGIIIGGSPLSVYETDPKFKVRIDRLKEFTRIMHQRRVPILGVCFGHQLIGETFGGKVEKNPEGREFGVVKVDLTKEGMRDTLLRDLSSTFEAIEAHEDIITKLPDYEKAVVLARNDMTPIQALSVGETTRGVQFHPEMDAKIIKKLATFRKNLLLSEGTIKNEADFMSLLQSLKDTPVARQVLSNFNRYFVLVERPKRSRKK